MRKISDSYKRILFGPLVSLSLVVGCGPADEPQTKVPDELLAPPAAGKGVQLSMSVTTPSGYDGEWCQFVKGPAEMLYLNSDEIRASAGGHHFLVFDTPYDDIPTTRLDGKVVDTSGPFDCTDGAIANWRFTKLIGGTQSPQAGSDFSFPPDVAMPLHANAVILLNGHFINASAKEQVTEVRVNLNTIPQADMKQEGDFLFFYNSIIYVPMKGQSQPRMRCPVRSDITLQNVQSHMHARGRGFEAHVMGGDSFYTTTKWADVSVRDFGAAGFNLKTGSTIEYSCDFTNTEDHDIFQGPKTTDEMCVLIGTYYPADPATGQCALDVNAPNETAGLGADWVGEGSATCSQTWTCLQPAFTNFNFGEITKCVAGANPNVAREVSDVLRCAISSPDPATACMNQIGACMAK